MMRWQLSNRADPVARELADRHYRTPAGDAVWVTSWPFAEYVQHKWAGAWVNSLFRNESAVLSSELGFSDTVAESIAYRT